MTDPQRLERCINALQHIALIVCFRVWVGEWPADGTMPGDCACWTCVARETLRNVGAVEPIVAYPKACSKCGHHSMLTKDGICTFQCEKVHSPD